MVLMCLLVVFIINANRSNHEYQEHVLSDLYHYYTSGGLMAAIVNFPFLGRLLIRLLG